MASQTQTTKGHCATHGTVDATREMPKPSFPFVVYMVRRHLAGKKPYRCPECRTEVAT